MAVSGAKPPRCVRCSRWARCWWAAAVCLDTWRCNCPRDSSDLGAPDRPSESVRCVVLFGGVGIRRWTLFVPLSFFLSFFQHERSRPVTLFLNPRRRDAPKWLKTFIFCTAGGIYQNVVVVKDVSISVMLRWTLSPTTYGIYTSVGFDTGHGIIRKRPRAAVSWQLGKWGVRFRFLE